MLDQALLESLVAEARLAPSVHNIQPTRWRRAGDRILVLADPTRRLPVADPTGHDVRLSHGAAIEGMALALSRRGLRIVQVELHPGAIPVDGGLIPVAALDIAPGGVPDQLSDLVTHRASWRARFMPGNAGTDQALADLARTESDLTVITEPGQIETIAGLADRAGFHFLCDAAHRKELLAWMRLSSGHAAHARDGLNAEAMALGRLEALAAGLVLGPLFTTLHLIGLAEPLTSDGAKTRSGAIALFHRPAGEDPVLTGRAFYRAWLGMTRSGLSACPVSVLVDWPESRSALTKLFPPPAGRRLVNVFRIGAAERHGVCPHHRLPVAELLEST